MAQSNLWNVYNFFPSGKKNIFFENCKFIVNRLLKLEKHKILPQVVSQVKKNKIFITFRFCDKCDTFDENTSNVHELTSFY